MISRFAVVVAAVVSMCAVPSVARADAEFSLGIGYSHVWMDGSRGAFDTRDGVRVEPRFTFNPSSARPELKLGFALAFSGYSNQLRDGDVVEIDHDVFVVTTDEWEALTLIQPEFQISWRQPVFAGSDSERGWFVEPGVGVGAVIGQYWIGDTWWGWSDEHDSQWDATIAARPFLRAGYQSQHWLAGLEASYLFGGSLDFGNDIGGDVRELYIGGFFGGRW